MRQQRWPYRMKPIKGATELALFHRIDRCLDLCKVERRGITADDIDWMVVFDRYMGTGHRLKSGDRARLIEILARVETSSPE